MAKIKCTVHSYYDTLLQMEQQYSARVALRFYDEQNQCARQVTYAQFAQDIRRMVSWLQQRPTPPQGQNICILSANNYHFAVANLAVPLTGAVLVPLNVQKSWADLQHELQLVQPACILHDGSYLEREPVLAQQYGGALAAIDAYTGAQPTQQLARRDPQQLAAIMFTSGTTGRSKGVMLSEKNIFDAMPAYVDGPFAEGQRLKGEDHIFSHFSMLPMYHIAAFTSLLSWVIAGQITSVCSGVRNFYRDLAAMPSEVTAVVPTIAKTLYNDVMRGRRDRLGELCILTCSAAAFPPDMLQGLVEHGLFIIQMYGMTETAGDGTMNYAQQGEPLTSVGQVDPVLQYKVLPDGELCFKGGPVMMGYYKDPEATAEVMDADGWLHTGDIVRFDQQNYLYITGRKKNLIILASGENVSPEELEKKLAACPDITEAVVKEKAGKICAVVYCEPARQDAVRAFVAQVNSALPLYQHITSLEFSSGPLPRNALGKLLRS